MNNQEAIASLKTLCHTCELFPKCAYEKPECFQAIELAISALQEQDSRRICDTCKHNPPSKKWPCVDCDMREPVDRWEPQEATHSTESSLTQKGLDTISRQAAIDALKGLPTWWADEGGYYGGSQPPMVALLDPEDADSAIENLPSAQPEIIRCKDCIHAIEDALCGGYWCKGKAVTSDHYCGYAERKTNGV